MPGIREWANTNPMLSVTATVVIGCGFIYWFISGAADPVSGTAISNSGQAWYYNTVTKKLLIDARGKPSPFVNDEGQECVRAEVIGCFDCSEKDRRAVLFEKTVDGQILISTTAAEGSWTEINKDQLNEARGKAMLESCGDMGRSFPCDPAFAAH